MPKSLLILLKNMEQRLSDMEQRLSDCEEQLAYLYLEERDSSAAKRNGQPMLDARQSHFLNVLCDVLEQLPNRCDKSIRETIRLYNEVSNDCSCAEQLHRRMEESGNGNKTLLNEVNNNAVRWRRQVQGWRMDVQKLGVRITEVEIGERFDPELHEAVDSRPPGDGEPETIAEAQTPLFTWRDEQGLQQVVPAEVVVFSSGRIDPTVTARCRT